MNCNAFADVCLFLSFFISNFFFLWINFFSLSNSIYFICKFNYGLYRSVFSILSLLFRFFYSFHFVQVKAMRNFDINKMMGFWYVVQYYASSEEAAEYSCMKCNFTMSDESALVRFFLLLLLMFLSRFTSFLSGWEWQSEWKWKW